MTLFERRLRNGKWKLKSWPKLREWIRNLRMPRTPTDSRTSGSISLELWKTVINTLVLWNRRFVTSFCQPSVVTKRVTSNVTSSAHRVALVDSACTSHRQLQRRFIKRQPTSPRPLVDLILRTADDANSPSFSSALDTQQQAARLNKQSWMAHMKERAMTLKQDLAARSVTALSMRWADQPGASTWLTALPLTSHGFDLTRREFHDGSCLRYGWEPSNLPSSCSCGQRFGLEHALTCRRGGYVAMGHDKVRDLFSELLAETCSNVTTEPELQPLDGVSLQTRGANCQDGARLDIKAGGFWGRSRFEATFFDVRVFNPYAASYRSTPPDNTFASHESEKRRLYEERVREVEGACFTPLVFACTGAAGKTSHVF